MLIAPKLDRIVSGDESPPIEVTGGLFNTLNLDDKVSRRFATLALTCRGKDGGEVRVQIGTAVSQSEGADPRTREPDLQCEIEFERLKQVPYKHSRSDR